MAQTMNIALSSSKKMFLPAYVTLTSMFENHQNVCVHAYILHSELEQEQIDSFRKLAEKYNGQIVECRVDRERLTGVRQHERVSVETYYRLFLTDYLPEDADRVLVVGTDVIINQNIEEYYNQDFEGKCIVVCKDFLTRKSVLEPEWYVLKFLKEEGYSYFNADVLLYNMNELRKIDLPGKFFEVEREFHDLLTIMDQDILNYLFYDKVKYVDENLYNFCARGFVSDEWDYDRVEKETKIIHYSGPVKPWDIQEFYCDLEYIWWEYAKKTDLYHEIADEFIKGIILESDVREYILTLRNKVSKLGKEVWEKRQQYFDMRREVKRLEKELESKNDSF